MKAILRLRFLEVDLIFLLGPLIVRGVGYAWNDIIGKIMTAKCPGPILVPQHGERS